MKMKKVDFLRIVNEEVKSFARMLREAPGDKQDDSEEDPKVTKGKGLPAKSSGPKKPEISAASEPGQKKAAKDTKPPGGPTPPPAGPPDDGGGEEQEVPDAEDPADQETDQSQEPKADSGLNDELPGKTVQSIMVEPKSKLLPGAKEIVISFNETSEPFKILVTATGMTKYYYHGHLYDEV